jgi:hypothetical protein
MRIEFYGDSITCGYGNIAPTSWEDFSTSTEDGMQTYAFLTAEALDAECTVLAKSGIPVNQTVYGKSETLRIWPAAHPSTTIRNMRPRMSRMRWSFTAA